MADPYPTIADAGARLRAGAVSSRELTYAALRRADALDPQLGAYAKRFDDEALAAAERADRELAAGHDRGPLHGIPVAVKDVIASREGPTTAQSRVVESSRWLGRDAPVVRRLRRAGAVITGKLTTMEFAIGMPDIDAPFPLPRNPWNLQTWPGGSSSGSAVATAAGLIFAGLGTDTGGSIRIPAAFCGVTGLMPTLGRVPTSGVVPLAFSLDRVGPIARSARDCATVLAAIAGHDPSDSSSSSRPVPELAPEADGGDLTGLRIGVARSDKGAGEQNSAVATQLEAVADTLAQAGARVCDVRLPYYAEGLSAARITMLAEALAYHRANLAARPDDYAASTRYVLAQGSLIPAADYVQAQRVRHAVQAALTETFEQVDAVITPTSATGVQDYCGLLGRVNAIADVMEVVYTIYWNAVAHPVIALPMGFTVDGLPLSVQIAGRPFEEATVVRVADAYQQRTDCHLRVPPPPQATDYPAPAPHTAEAVLDHDSSADAAVRSALARMSVALPDEEMDLLANDAAPLAGMIESLRTLDAAQDVTPALEFQTCPSRPTWWCDEPKQ